MRVIILLALIALSYAILSIDWAEYWLRSITVVPFVLGFLYVSLNGHFSARQSHFVGFRRLRIADYAVAIGSFIFLHFCLFVFFLKVPQQSASVRDTLVDAMGAGEVQDGQQDDVPSDAGNSGDEEVRYEAPEAQLVHNEKSSLAIPKRIFLKQSAFPEVYVRPQDEVTREALREGSIYLVSRRLAAFDGNVWQSQQGSLDFLRANPEGWVELQSEQREDSLFYEVEHAEDKNLLLAIPTLQKVQLPHVKVLGNEQVFLPSSEGKRRRYKAISKPLMIRALPLESRKQAAAEVEDTRYLEVPITGALAESLEAFTAQIDTSKTKWQQLQQLRRLLNSRCQYSLQVENPQNHHPIVNFLDHEKKGFCLHYATTTALVSRKLGIPSRIAVGYVGGEYFSARDMFVFYTKDLHAWVEVKFDGLGWVSYDTSPPQVYRSRVAEADSEPAELMDRQEALAEMEQRRSEESLEAFNLTVIFEETKWLMLIIAVLAGLLGACFVWQRSERKKKSKQKENRDRRHYHQEPPYFSLFRRVCELNGVPMVFGDTLRAQVEMLEQKQLKPGFADSLLEYHYATTYRDQPRDTKKEAKLIKQMKKWKR